MSVADLDKVESELHEALAQHVITAEECSFLRAVAEDEGTNARCDGWALSFMLACAVPWMNGEPSQVHSVLRASLERIGVSLEDSIAELPVYFVDEGIVQVAWQRLPMLDGLESYEAIIEVCHQAAANVGIQLGFLPSHVEAQTGMCP